MNLFDRHPEDLAEQSEPAQVLAALRAVKELTIAQLAVLDVYLNHWVLLVLLRPRDREGILEVQQLCELAQDMMQELNLNVLEDQATVQSLRARFEAFGDLLEGKRRVLQGDQAETAPKLLHEEAILELASHPLCKQLDIAGSLNLSAGRVSQLLGVLESRGKIIRQRRGKESWVSLPAKATAAAKPGDAGSKSPATIFFSNTQTA